MELLARRTVAVLIGPVAVVAALGLFIPSLALAQASEDNTRSEGAAGEDDASADRDRGGAAAATEQIVITGTKKARGTFAADAPVAVTAFGDEQLEALQFRDMESLTFSIPNVSLDSNGTTKGVANFSIRGLGATSSIPTIDPTVGLFVNGVYFGTNAGAVLDTFDLEAIEVLRGPQGILFGRNVTGGAVLLRTKRPGDTYAASLKANIETGLESRIYGAVDLPVAPEFIKFRLAGQFRNDDGWFTNSLDNSQFGAEQTWLVRPTMTITPTDFITLHVMYERGNTEAQGPASQSSSFTSSPDFAGPFDDFDFSIDELGFANYEWNHIFAELKIDLGAVGTLTDIFGYRTVEALTRSDIDSQPLSIFHADAAFDVDHWSNELRYNGSWFNNVIEPTAGLYIFGQDIKYRERRVLLGAALPEPMLNVGALDSSYGGDQAQLTLGAFTQIDINITDFLTAIAGVRYTWEEKEASIAAFGEPDAKGEGNSPCPRPEDAIECDNLRFNETQTWDDVSPKLGARWKISKRNQVYGHWTRGFRAGGYNVRNTSALFQPQSYDQEQQDAFELGLKSAVLSNRLRFNVAGFFTIMNDMQRQVNVPDETAGVVQIVRNTADANVYGFEVDATVIPAAGLVFTGSFGYTDAEYTRVAFDISGDEVVDENDEALELPRLANITANIGGLYDLQLGDLGTVTFRANYAYRDESFSTDNNLGRLPSGHVIDASIAYLFPYIEVGSTYLTPKLTVYGRNLANEVFLGGNTILPADLNGFPLGGNFSPLKEGRVLGAEFRIDWE